MSTNINFAKKLGLGGETRIDLPAFDASYKAILYRAIALGYTLPSADQQAKQNSLLVSLKTIGVWNKLDVFYVFAQNGGSAFGTLNWKNPNANQSTLVNAPTFVSNGGLMGNGTSSYIDTNYNPSTQGVQYTLNNASMYFFTHAISGAGAFAGVETTAENRMWRQPSSQQRINQGSTALPSAFDFTAVVNTKSIHRTSSTNITLYNSTTGENRTVASSVMPTQDLFVLKSQTSHGAHTSAGFAAGASLIAEHTNFINAWNTYKSSL